MLVRLLRNQIEEKWNVIKVAIANSLPPTVNNDEISTQKCINNIRLALMNGSMQAWVLAEGRKVLAIGTTAITIDKISGEKSLIIYTLFGCTKLDIKDWEGAFESLKAFAKSVGCSTVCAFSDVDRVKEIADGLNANTSNIFIKWEV